MVVPGQGHAALGSRDYTLWNLSCLKGGGPAFVLVLCQVDSPLALMALGSLVSQGERMWWGRGFEPYGQGNMKQGWRLRLGIWVPLCLSAGPQIMDSEARGISSWQSMTAVTMS